MSEPTVTSTSNNHSARISKDPHSVAHEQVPPESRPVGQEDDATSGPNDSSPAPAGEQYPPQLHAGHVGYGPHYAEVHGKETGFAAKMTGLKEQLKGKVTHNRELEQRGRDRQTGELKAKQQAEDDAKNPFQSADSEQGDNGDNKGAQDKDNGTPASPKPQVHTSQERH